MDKVRIVIEGEVDGKVDEFELSRLLSQSGVLRRDPVPTVQVQVIQPPAPPEPVETPSASGSDSSTSESTSKKDKKDKKGK